jgi:S-adenosylmethionine:tRNA ribosyltransferase-isomerase
MRAEDLDYELPEGAIAQTPVEPRHAARLLVDRGRGRSAEHRTVWDLPDLLEPGDLVVVNDTRVRAARLNLRKATGGAAEVLLLEPTGRPAEWRALVRPGRRLPPGTVLLHGEDPAVAIGAVLDDEGRRLVTVVGEQAAALAASVPLPPYIHAPLEDPERYQTVFARREASVAAPTAGLHLTHEVLDRLERAAVGLARVELEVGLGTFRPVTAERLEDHVMHAEAYRIDPGTWERIIQAPRVVAVGTTVVRTLETVAATGALWGDSRLFIRPGFRWQVVDRLMTNFHVPRSTLLALVEAFVGPRWRELYGQALSEGYRFLSFGDAMLLARSEAGDHPGGDRP